LFDFFGFSVLVGNTVHNVMGMPIRMSLLIPSVSPLSGIMTTIVALSFGD